MQLPDKMLALRSILLRNDLSSAELRIYLYLLTQVMNAAGNCTCSNQHLARALSIKPSTVHRAKKNLQKKQLIAWPNTGKLAASAHLACSYNLLINLVAAPAQLASTAPTQSPLAAPPQSGLAAPTQPAQPGQTTGTSPGQTTGIKIIKFTDPAFEALELLERRTGISSPRNKRGDALVTPKRWLELIQ